MKHKQLLAVLLLLVAGLQTAVAQKMVLTFDDNTKVEYDVAKVKDVTFAEAIELWVDLGLPSGTLWASHNIGASSPEDYGDYFAWGETEPKTDYGWATYKHCLNSPHAMTRYCSDSNYGAGNMTDDLTELLPEDDAAAVNWGGNSRMPSMEQIQELCNTANTQSEWTTRNGVAGCKITSKINGKSIFLPAAGCVSQNDSYSSPSQTGSFGYYWGRTLCSYNTEYGDYLEVSSTRAGSSSYYRNYGQSVRPVLVPQKVTDITLNYTSLILELNESETLTATVLPDNADNKDVAWTSSDETVATVSADGFVTGVALGSCIITCSATDGSGIAAECQVTVHKIHGTTDGHEWVDLGLPTGTLWATCNIGASSPERFGDYFAWGETQTKNVYRPTNYVFGGQEDGFGPFSKYNEEDGMVELLPEDDAATANWGSAWQMPSRQQCAELINPEYTTAVKTTRNNVDGFLITSKINGGSIFLPFAGWCIGYVEDDESLGFYNSRTLNAEQLSNVYGIFIMKSARMDQSLRTTGSTIRPVLKQQNSPTGQTYTVNGVSFRMIDVEGGTFQMGSTTGNDDEQPVHEVRLSNFSIGETEVRQELWEAVMGSNPSLHIGSKLPVEQVTWNDCQTFITRLNELTGKTFRLPTEAEWEYAARGGNRSNGYTYSGSNTIDDVAWYYSNSGNTTHDVATKAPNELGIYDMSGNVYEWCQDWYGDYSSDSQTNPTGPDWGSYRVVRSGCYGDLADISRVSFRVYIDPTIYWEFVGFRLAQ